MTLSKLGKKLNLKKSSYYPSDINLHTKLKQMITKPHTHPK